MTFTEFTNKITTIFQDWDIEIDENIDVEKERLKQENKKLEEEIKLLKAEINKKK